MAGLGKFGDAGLRPLVQKQLQAGETLVWTGRPGPGALAARRLVTSVFGVFFLGFSLFWVTMALRTVDPAGPAPLTLFPLFGVPFVLAGAGLVLWAPFALIQARYITYAISDRRALVIAALPWTTVKSYGPGDIGAIERTERADGSGTVTFHQQISARNDGISFGDLARPALGRDGRFHFGGGGNRSVTRIGFVGVPAVRAVEAHLLALKNGRKDGPWS